MIARSLRFSKFADLVLTFEGDKLSLDPNDKGNWTGGSINVGVLKGSKFGISAAVYPYVDIKNLTRDQALDIYFRDYFVFVYGDSLPEDIALVVFDTAINNGVYAAAKFLQQSLNNVVIDSRIGPITVKAAQMAAAAGNSQAICIDILSYRMIANAAGSGWSSYKMGWCRRLFALPYKVMEMEKTKI